QFFDGAIFRRRPRCASHEPEAHVMKRIPRQKLLDGFELAVVIWMTAVAAGAMALVPSTSSVGQWERTLPALASAALAFLGYTEFAERSRRIPTPLQSVVWLGTFVLVLFFLARALTRQSG